MTVRHPWLGSHRTPRAVGTATLAAIVAVALAACGSSSGDANSSGSGLTAIKVGLGGNIFDIPLRVADQMGYFKKHGLQVQFVSLAPTAGTPALQSGSLQFLNDSPTDFLIAESKGTNELSVGVDAVGAPLGLVASTKFASAHHLTASTPAATVAKALVGSTAGASAATTKAETGIMLRSYSVSLSQQKWVTLPTPAADKAALKSGEIDWFTTSEPTPLSLQASGDGVVLVNPDKSPAWANSQIGSASSR